MDAHVADFPRFEAWRAEIESPPSAEHLMATMRDYLALWSKGALALLPGDIAAPALPSREALCARAFLASQAELGMWPDDPRHACLKEMTLALVAAAARLQALDSYRSVAHVTPANLRITGARGQLEAEIRRK